ncbi:hypothetical protein CDAR_189521 [Caerostris darwini]|uniref:Uncharacterized protein n=1 Tax=Caerostris darwini TaxID=1538125 RepID=A0AAV4QTC4_9ARAC|nr:hypothetical protein CDAR_189521 [Caerostris darwini]
MLIIQIINQQTDKRRNIYINKFQHVFLLPPPVTIPKLQIAQHPFWCKNSKYPSTTPPPFFPPIRILQNTNVSNSLTATSQSRRLTFDKNCPIHPHKVKGRRASVCYIAFLHPEVLLPDRTFLVAFNEIVCGPPNEAGGRGVQPSSITRRHFGRVTAVMD